MKECDVAKCEFYGNYGICKCKYDESGKTSLTNVASNECSKNPNCYYKQLRPQKYGFVNLKELSIPIVLEIIKYYRKLKPCSDVSGIYAKTSNTLRDTGLIYALGLGGGEYYDEDFIKTFFILKDNKIFDFKEIEQFHPQQKTFTVEEIKSIIETEKKNFNLLFSPNCDYGIGGNEVFNNLLAEFEKESKK